jgi:electron transport complex protein RnfD
MMNSVLPSAPHLHAPENVPSLMRAVLWAILPATLYGVGLFGWPAFNLLVSDRVEPA